MLTNETVPRRRVTSVQVALLALTFSVLCSVLAGIWYSSRTLTNIEDAVAGFPGALAIQKNDYSDRISGVERRVSSLEDARNATAQSVAALQAQIIDMKSVLEETRAGVGQVVQLLMRRPAGDCTGSPGGSRNCDAMP